MDAHQKTIRERVQAVVDSTGLSLSALATQAGLSHTTLTRFMNNPDVTHALSSRTLAKIAGIADRTTQGDSPSAATSIPEVADRMRLVRRAMAGKLSDDDVSRALGWEVDHLQAILAGDVPPTVQEIIVFCARMRVTTDFVLTESLEGLSRVAERLLLAVDPDLGAHIDGMEQDRGTPLV